MNHPGEQRVRECAEALKGITPLPWTADEPGLYIFAGGTMSKGFTRMVADSGDGEHENLTVRIRGFGGGEPQERNLHAIATVMNAAPDLLARIESLTTELSEVRRDYELALVVAAEFRQAAHELEEKLERTESARLHLIDMYETSHASRMHADGAVLRLEVELSEVRVCGVVTGVSRQTFNDPGGDVDVCENERPCADCTCSNFSAKVVDRRGLGPQYPRHDPNARCSPRQETR